MMPPGLLESVDLTKATIQKLPLQQVAVDVLRLDRIHPVISGNKWFKLKYYLQAAVELGKKGIVSFGGAYSNHLLATACACAQMGLKSAAFVRGEEPVNPSATLLELGQYGMELVFTGRAEYQNKSELKKLWDQRFQDYYWVNEGGSGEDGIRGASEILALTPFQQYSHIIAASGTGTMVAGLLQRSLPHQNVISVPVLKIADRQNNELSSFIAGHAAGKPYEIWYEHHEGGYARKSAVLLEFMRRFYEQYGIPTDFVYTSKLFKALFQKIEDGYFSNESRILAIHSGGLQGNRSLSEKEQALMGKPN